MAARHPIAGSNLPLDGVVRVSRVAGNGGEIVHSLDDQRKAVVAAIEKRGREVGEVFVERAGAGEPSEGAALRRVVERVRAGQSGGVVAARLSSFGRPTGELVVAIDEIIQAGGVFISLEGLIDSTAAAGRAFLGIVSVFAEIERERLSETGTDGSD